MSEEYNVKELGVLTITSLGTTAKQFTSTRILAEYIRFDVSVGNPNEIFIGSSAVSTTNHFANLDASTEEQVEINPRGRFLMELSGFWAVASGGTTGVVTLHYF